MLEDKLPGIKIGQRARSTAEVAHADDVTVFMTRPTDFDTIHRAIQLYEKATGARLNPKKSKALVTGKWMVPATLLEITCCTHIKILGVTFGTTIEYCTKESWTCELKHGRDMRETYVSHRECIMCSYAYYQKSGMYCRSYHHSQYTRNS